MAPGALAGLFVRDVRFVSRWSLLVDDRAPEPLTVVPGDTWSATLLARVPAGTDGGALLVERRRLVGDGMREDLRVRNLAAGPGGRGCTCGSGATSPACSPSGAAGRRGRTSPPNPPGTRSRSAPAPGACGSPRRG